MPPQRGKPLWAPLPVQDHPQGETFFFTSDCNVPRYNLCLLPLLSLCTLKRSLTPSSLCPHVRHGYTTRRSPHCLLFLRLNKPHFLGKPIQQFLVLKAFILWLQKVLRQTICRGWAWRNSVPGEMRVIRNQSQLSLTLSFSKWSWALSVTVYANWG